MIRKVLVANRGEIAIRVLKACRELGIETATIFSEADRDSLHLRYADEAHEVGPPPPVESYLAIEKIIEIAKRSGSDAIHPGYGFLAENPDFARACEEARIIYIGPSSEALTLVGDKIAARETVRAAGVPIIPGTPGIREVEELIPAARRIGFPILLKAALGGGGKGMRVISREEELKGAFEASQREAGSAFGDDTVYIEKYLEYPRHIEFQILADHHGNIIHLNERECSIQRRHQKIVEESPSVALDHALRGRMGEAAKKVIKASGYTNAGTVEFMLDRDKNFYFLEVNARIQVEHPVTELVTGVDLVKQQIMIASGEVLSLKQEDIGSRGHAIECRIYAEDPTRNFLPSPGKILFLREPSAPGLRVDSGIYTGFEVSPYYDPILSKLIAWGQNREEARVRALEGLKEYTILGISTIVPFLINILEDDDFIRGNLHTRFVDEKITELNRTEPADLALIGYALVKSQRKREVVVESKREFDPWLDLGSWELGSRGD
ncbi:MAG TPA: acetyl-CoA carboxylase biotin carboxylase subunit [bacterium (Candidatus Stahlbacteria)]|nr:acetyl-CoA carboxylase biotin carboxylase subunit [Candidatus Stahlbacteria bacterium]